MYYLTYRPRTLDELDNTSVKKQLTNILNSGSLPHAFLFTGPKGTGKTSTARIVAKILNAEENTSTIKTISPSEADDNVKAITQGTSPDVIEMDAASNRKIDDIRTLISELKFAPLVSKYKIYIIDEVHMLTKEAFNALLKSLEEPPSSTVFILATTEADALPSTIRSRCVTVQFSQATIEDISSMLKRICNSEKISLSDEILNFIAEHADGSFRDAAKTLEMTVMQKITTVNELQALLGNSSHKTSLLHILTEETLAHALSWIQEAVNEGASFRIIIESLLQELHTLLLEKNGIDVQAQSTYNVSTKEIVLLMSLLQRAYNDIKYSPIQSLPLEMVVVEFFETKKAQGSK